MNLKIYYNISENNQLSKDITLISDLTGTLRDSSDIVNPRILIEADSIANGNYAYISQFNRYYYIKEVTSVRNGLLLLQLESDPLMSFKTDIKRLSVVLAESEQLAVDRYLPDERVWLTKVKDKTDIISFPYGLSANGDYILITAGGIAT